MSWAGNAANDSYGMPWRERNKTEARRAHYRAAYARRKAARQEVMHEAA